MEDSNPELEQFRQQWRAEVSAKAQVDGNKKTSHTSKQSRKPAHARVASASLPIAADDSTDLETEGHQNITAPSGSRLDHGHRDSSKALSSKAPKSALDHYEKAVEREEQGNLGDSLDLYRKAFRIDHRVDQIYKNKHFPPSSFPPKLAKANPSNAPVTIPNPAHHSLDGPPKSIKDLVASFSGLKIEPAPPVIEGTPALPCYLAELPEEILVQILTDVAIQDIAAFVRTAQVCKRLAFLVTTEEQIWKRICQGKEYGFAAMHYDWQKEVLGGPLESDEDDEVVGEDDLVVTNVLKPEALTEALFTAGYSSSWQKMFKTRPRIRFNGCYISTVNYIRAGQASPSQLTWSSPVHIVTYFRYLRFFRDGTVISLCTTVEPADAVHHLTKELQETHRGGAAPYLPSVFMQNALRGRWRLSTIDDNPDVDLKDADGDLFVETEGANERYLYRMKLSLRNSGKAARNNKLTWQGFWSYNMLTDDTGEFTLRNDKAFVFSRVKSYGLGA